MVGAKQGACKNPHSWAWAQGLKFVGQERGWESAFPFASQAILGLGAEARLRENRAGSSMSGPVHFCSFTAFPVGRLCVLSALVVLTLDVVLAPCPGLAAACSRAPGKPWLPNTILWLRCLPGPGTARSSFQETSGLASPAEEVVTSFFSHFCIS